MGVYKNDPNLVSLWLLEEASGTRYDAVGSNDLTDNNTVGQSTADKKQGVACADFEEGNSEYLSIADVAQVGLDIVGDLSVCFWMKSEAFGSTEQQVVAKYRISDSNRSYRIVVTESTARIGVNLSSDGIGSVGAWTANSTVAAGTWYHIAVVYDGTDIRIFIDGVLSENGVNNPVAYSDGIFDSAAAFCLGRQDGGGYYYDGLLDEVAIFDRALSADEVAAIYNLGILDFPVFRRRREMVEAF